MKTNNVLIGSLIAIIIVLAGALLYTNRQPTEKPFEVIKTEEGNEQISDNATTTATSSTPGTKKPVTQGTAPITLKGFRSYTNSPYNFTIQYPSYVKTGSSFSTFHNIGTNWRIYPSPANQGKQVAAFTIFSTDQGDFFNGHQTYPLYFLAEVRIGVSPNVKECYTPDSGYTNQKVTNITINGVTFKKFSAQDAGMMKYTQVESYRTIHNNMCFALEQIKAGSSYRDEKMATGIADSQLTNYFNLGEAIIKTFKFTK